MKPHRNFTWTASSSSRWTSSWRHWRRFLLQRPGGVPPGICHRIRLLRPDTVEAYIGIEDGENLFFAGQVNGDNRIRRSRRTGYHWVSTRTWTATAASHSCWDATKLTSVYWLTTSWPKVWMSRTVCLLRERIPHLASSGWCRHATDRTGLSAGTGESRPLRNPAKRNGAEIDRIVNFVSTFSVKADKINDALEKLGNSSAYSRMQAGWLNQPSADYDWKYRSLYPRFQAALDKIEDRKKGNRGSRNPHQIQRLHRPGAYDCRQDTPVGVHPNQRKVWLREPAIPVDRWSPPEAGEDRPGNPGTSQPHPLAYHRATSTCC